MFGNADKMFPIFFGTWIVLGILSFYLFFIRNDYEFKVKYFKFFVILVGILFLGFVTAMGVPPQVFVIMVPAVALITFLNIKFTRFCKNCGKTIINNVPFTKIEFCPKCGSKLQDRS
jgi:hypothetical protein